jgi:hypothetical protein
MTRVAAELGLSVAALRSTLAELRVENVSTDTILHALARELYANVTVVFPTTKSFPAELTEIAGTKQDLSGLWHAPENITATIVQDGKDLAVYIGKNRGPFSGRLIGGNAISVVFHDDPGCCRGTIIRSTEIQWNNGTSWLKRDDKTNLAETNNDELPVAVECWAQDRSDGAIGGWKSGFPHCILDDGNGDENAIYDGFFYTGDNRFCVVMMNLTTAAPPNNRLAVGFRVSLQNRRFVNGQSTKVFEMIQFRLNPSGGTKQQCMTLER